MEWEASLCTVAWATSCLMQKIHQIFGSPFFLGFVSFCFFSCCFGVGCRGVAILLACRSSWAGDWTCSNARSLTRCTTRELPFHSSSLKPSVEFPLWYSRSGIHHCCSYGVCSCSHCHSSDSVPGLGTSICWGYGQKKRKEKNPQSKIIQIHSAIHPWRNVSLGWQLDRAGLFWDDPHIKTGTESKYLHIQSNLMLVQYPRVQSFL